jgi:hypothetical protein
MSEFGSVFSLACLLVLGLVGSEGGLFDSSFEPKRIKKRRVIIKGKDGKNNILQREEITFKNNVQGWVTIEQVSPIILSNGTKITSHIELAGSCFFCDELVAVSDQRVCDCGRLVCFEHSRYDDQDQKYYCADCHKKLRRKRFFRFLLSPFIEKVDEDK